MNVLLVYPEFPDTFWSFKHALKFIRKKAGSPPLGLLTVASLLPSGWDKRLVDTNVQPLTNQDLNWADFVFISAMVVQRCAARKMIARCKAAGVKVVAGGPLFTCEAGQFPEVDHLVLGEAEITLPRFLQDLALGQPARVYNTDVYPDIKLSPAPLWHLINMDRYDTMSIQFSRGCPYNCDFCNITALLGHRPRTKAASQIVAELDALYQLGWRKNVFFVDDNFIGNKKLIKEEVLPALIEWRKGKRGMPFQTEVTINLADDEDMMRLMANAGFSTVFVGIETPSDESLGECSKKPNQGRDLVESVRKIQRSGMEVQGGFIVGFDSDTSSIFQQQIDFIQKSGIATAMVGLLQAPYGTKLYDRLAREGRLLMEISGDNMDGSTNIIPKMGIHALKAGYRRLLEYIYAPEHYYARVKTFLKEYQPPRFSAPIDKAYVMGFLRSVYQLGIRGVERTHYWRLVFWTLLHKPRLFPLAITLSIYGFHFRNVVNLHVK
jgi:radical SAM superfamily enzyme YgiQ (UPF0313 family)